MIKERTALKTIRLIATDAIGAIRKYDLGPNQSVFVGSSTNCGLQIKGSGLSGIHCHIANEDAKLFIQDWISAKGTRVNGKEISQQVELHLGDVIQIGNHEIAVSEDLTSGAPHSAQMESPSPASVPKVEFSDEFVASEPSKLINREDAEDVTISDTLSSETSSTDTPISETTEPMDFESAFFDFPDEETYDKETVALLYAEIEDLQATLAQRDAGERFERSCSRCEQRRKDDLDGSIEGDADKVLQRMQELIEEANRSDERVAMLEEILTTAEEANRAASEERKQLESWVADIESRVGQREQEHAAEIDTLKEQLEESTERQNKLREQLRQAAVCGNAPKQYEDTLENLQSTNKSLQGELARYKRECASLEQRCEHIASDQERGLREERANIAKEQARLSRMRFEISSKLDKVEELPKPENPVDKETAHRIRVLREHLREIHEQEKAEEKEESIVTRLTKLWKRVEY